MPDTMPDVTQRCGGVNMPVRYSLYGVDRSATYLKDARKGSSENVPNRAHRVTMDAGVRFGRLAHRGLPGETEEALEHVCEWLKRISIYARQVSLGDAGQDFLKRGIEERCYPQRVDTWVALDEQALVQRGFLNAMVCRNRLRELPAYLR